MKVTYDPKTDSLTVILKEGVILDYDEQGNLLSLEIPRRLPPGHRRQENRVSDDCLRRLGSDPQTTPDEVF